VDHLLAREKVDVVLEGVKLGVRKVAPGDSLDHLELLVSEDDVSVGDLVVEGLPPVIRLLHLVQKLVQLVLLDARLHDLLALEVISQMRVVIIPLCGDPSKRVLDMLQKKKKKKKKKKKTPLFFKLKSRRKRIRKPNEMIPHHQMNQYPSHPRH